MTPPLSIADSGHTTFRALLLVSGAPIIASRSAKVVVSPSESILPAVLSAFRDPLDSLKIVVVFSEPVLADSATNPNNYEISGATVNNAGLVTPNTSHLSVSSLGDCQSAPRLMIRGVQDFSGNSVSSNLHESVFIGPLPVLLIVNDSRSLGASDAAVRERLAARGFVVLLHDQSAAAPQPDNYGLAILSSTVVPSALAAGYRDLRLPLLTWKQELYDDLGFTSDDLVGHGRDSLNRITILGSDHLLSAGLHTGDYDVAPAAYGYCTPAGNAVQAVIEPSFGRIYRPALVFGYDVGATMHEGFRAPARRVGFFWNDDSPSIAHETEWRLFDAAVDWLMIPIIIQQPESQTVAPGTAVTLCVVAASRTPPVYQWRLNGQNIPGANGATLTISNAQPRDGGSYSVVVANQAGAVNSAIARIVIDSPPLNLTDQFVNNFGDVSASRLGRGSNTLATAQPGERHAGKPGGKSVWYSWRAAADGLVTFTTRGSGFDTLLAAYTGASIDVLSLVAQDEDSAGFFTSALSFNAQANTTYHIAVDGLAGDAGDIVLGWDFVPVTEILPTILLQPVSQAVTQGASITLSAAANFASEYQWYFNGAPVPGAVNPTLLLDNIQREQVGLYHVVATNRFNNNPNVNLSARSDTAIVEISSASAAFSQDKLQDLFLTGPVGLMQRFSATKAAPPNFVVSVAAGTIGSHVLNNANSTTQQGEPNHCGLLGGSTRWLSLRSTNDGLSFIVDTLGSSVGTTLSAYTGTDPLTLREVACDSGYPSVVTFAAARNVDYQVALDGTNGAQGILQLNWKLGAPPVITTQPLSQRIRVASHVTFAVAATGIPVPQYQWYRDDEPLPGQTNNTLALANIALTDAGRYTVSVSNLMAVVLSDEATLTVQEPVRVTPAAVSLSGESFRLRVTSLRPQGTIIIQASSNLEHWQTILRGIADSDSFEFSDPTAASQAMRFYRVLLEE